MVYDPATNLWTAKASLPTPRHDPAGGAAGGKFFMITTQWRLVFFRQSRRTRRSTIDYLRSRHWRRVGLSPVIGFTTLGVGSGPGVGAASGAMAGFGAGGPNEVTPKLGQNGHEMATKMATDRVAAVAIF